jgi:UDP-hydrolysing UDP-N-acetyl-D-glucosamine 2-epimerase
MIRKILYITGTRADFGLMQSTLRRIAECPDLKLELAVTGMHLMADFGKTVDEVESSGFKIHRLDAAYENDDKESMASFVGRLIELLVEKVKEIQPDMILLLGDRGEMLAGAIVGAYMAIPVVHIHGGDVSSTVDDPVRHAITKLAHLHLAATTMSAERIVKMGEESWRVFIVGAPGLDSLLNETAADIVKTAKKFDLDLQKPILIVLQHPVILETISPSDQMRKTLKAVSDLGYQTLIIYPNADAGGREMIEVILEYARIPHIKTFKNIPRKDFLALMKTASALIGNSSSGIIEAPSLGLPVVNIGSRQDKRDRGENIIDVGYESEQIKSAIKKAINDKDFQEMAKNSSNPYGDGKAGERIAQILSNIKIDKKLLQKTLCY